MFSSLLFFAFSTSWAQEPEATKTEPKAWTEAEKSTFVNSCNSGRPDHISEKEMNRICSCTQSKLSVRFSPAQLETTEAQQYSNQVIAECALGSKGKWSATLKSQFLNGCTGNVKSGINTEQLKEICSCSLNLLEARFDPSELEGPAVQDFSANVAKTCQEQVLAK